jgi:GTP-binding protein
MLVDEAKITVTSGNGGAGRVAFYPNRGAPCGGDGGNGGSIFAVVDVELTSLFRYARKKEYKAEDGGIGGTFAKAGSAADDLTLHFPEGTQLIDLATQEVIELNGSEPVLLCKGGHGGYGNTKVSLRKPGVFMTAYDGRPGQTREFQVTMRLIADVGLIGFPNAGKSSLLNVLTSARARVADYPFTTLDPNLGVIEVSSSKFQVPSSKNKIILADIPGLIEGASEGKGLGVKFLKHVEKVSMFLHCISCESKDIKGDYEKIRGELGAYNPLLLEKPEIILITKSDLIEEISKKIIKEKIEKKLDRKVYFCSVIDDGELITLKQIINDKYQSSSN